MANKTNIYPHSVLYYPTIEFASENWLKRALLFWDHVYRIVPDGYKPNDSQEVKLLQDEGLIINIGVSESEKEKSALAFLKFFKSLKYKPAGLSEQINERLNVEKVDYRLYPLLDEISQEVRNGNSTQWFYLSEQVARAYMFFLSQTIAESRRLVRATDIIDMWSIAPYFTEKGNFPFEDVPYNEQNKGVYASMMLDDVLPANLDSISAKQIAAFNLERRNERREFMDKINELVDRLPHIKSKEQWKDEAQFLLDEVEQDKADFRKSQPFWNSGMPSSVFGVGVPLTLTGWGVISSLEGQVGCAVFGAVAAFMDYRKVKKQRNPSYSSYLVGLDNAAAKHLTSRSIAAYASNTMSEFIND